MTLNASQTRIAQGVIAAAKARGLPRAAAEAAIAVIYAECSGLVMYANNGNSTQTIADQGRQLNAAERAVARLSLNYPHDAVGQDLDSMGLFQQRPSANWGPPSELMDPEMSTGKFYDGVGGNRGLVDIPGWESLPPWEAGRRVQGSLPIHANLYSDAYPTAVAIVDQLWGTATFDILEWIATPSYS
jgi:hypothetical protein